LRIAVIILAAALAAVSAYPQDGSTAGSGSQGFVVADPNDLAITGAPATRWNRKQSMPGRTAATRAKAA